MSYLFGILYAQPSIVEGVARAIDFGGTLDEYNQSITGQQADAIAMNADWQVVGDDLIAAAWAAMPEASEQDDQ